MPVKKTYLLFLLILTINPVFAQFDFRLTSAYGLVSLKPNTSLDINIEPGNFLTAGIQADYYLDKNFGVGIGADYHLLDFNFDVVLSNYYNSYSGTDNWQGDPVPREYEFTIKSNAPDIIEKNTMSFFEIPVSVIYSISLIENVYLAARLGLKLGIPLDGEYELVESDLYTRLYFEEWDLELFDIPAHGLYDGRTDWHPSGKLNLNNIYSIFTEIGLDFPVSLFKVRISGYLSYGLNNIYGENQSSLIYWREDYNNILSLPESVNMIQSGIKLGIGFITKKERKNKYKRSMKDCPSYW